MNDLTDCHKTCIDGLAVAITFVVGVIASTLDAMEMKIDAIGQNVIG